MKKIVARLFVLVLIVTACITVPSIMPEETSISSVAMAEKVAINQKTATIFAGDTINLKITGTSKTPTWSSSNKKVARVNSRGKVTGVKAGTAVITAKIGTKKFKCDVTVLSVLSVSSTNISLTAGNSKKITCTYLVEGTIYADIADTDIVSCKWGGWNGSKIPLTITGKEPGTTTITISNNKTKDVKKIKVTVGSALSLSGTNISLIEDESKTIICTYKVDGGTISYDIADPDIVSCKWGDWNGRKIPLTITGKEPGTTTITISNNEAKDVKKIKVTVESKIKLKIPSLPKAITDKRYSGSTTVDITNITYSYSSDYKKITVYLTGKMTYGSETTSQSSAIGWRLIDEEGFVIDTGTAYTDSLTVGDKFKDLTIDIYDVQDAGTYTLELRDVV